MRHTFIYIWISQLNCIGKKIFFFCLIWIVALKKTQWNRDCEVCWGTQTLMDLMNILALQLPLGVGTYCGLDCRRQRLRLWWLMKVHSCLALSTCRSSIFFYSNDLKQLEAVTCNIFLAELHRSTGTNTAGCHFIFNCKAFMCFCNISTFLCD